jgi:hypothetical protein
VPKRFVLSNCRTYCLILRFSWQGLGFERNTGQKSPYHWPRHAMAMLCFGASNKKGTSHRCACAHYKMHWMIVFTYPVEIVSLLTTVEGVPGLDVKSVSTTPDELNVCRPGTTVESVNMLTVAHADQNLAQGKLQLASALWFELCDCLCIPL